MKNGDKLFKKLIPDIDEKLNIEIESRVSECSLESDRTFDYDAFECKQSNL